MWSTTGAQGGTSDLQTERERERERVSHIVLI